jgi:anti-sigma-K factor RskA
MAHVETLGKATILATFARLACAAASTVTVVALQITAPLQRVANHPLVAAQDRSLSSVHLLADGPTLNEHSYFAGMSPHSSQATSGESDGPWQAVMERLKQQTVI